MPLVEDGPVGRSGELARIEALLDRVAKDHASVVVVAGEAGVGKSTLLEAAVDRAAQRGFAVALGRCAPSQSPPYWPWPRVFRALCGSTGPFAIASKGRAALFAAGADCLEQASAERPVFIAVDDLQWADESSLALASYLAAAGAGLPIGLAFGVRDDAGERSPPLTSWLAELPADVVHLSLGGIDRSAAFDLVRSVLGREPSATMVDDLHARTGGNPLFVAECARLLAEPGISAPLQVPERVRQVITRHLARLTDEAYTVLAAAAVADEFDLDVLAGLTDLTATQVAEGLGEALAARLVITDGDDYRFAHELLRDTLLDTQPHGRRVMLHQRAADMFEARLEGSPPPVRGALAAQAAAHRARVPGGGSRAAALAVDAARQAADLLAHDHAATLYRWAQELGDHSLDTLTDLGEAQVLAGQLSRGRETLATVAVRASAERRGDLLCRAVLAGGSGVGGYEVDVRDPQQVPRLRDVLALIGDDDRRLRSAVLARIALVDTSLTVEDRAALADDAAAMAARSRDIAAEVAALAARCDILSGPDHVEDRLAATTRMVQLAQQHGDPVTLLVARRQRLLALLEHGEIGRADDEIAAYARTSDHLRLPLYSWTVPVWRGMRCLMDGDHERARRHCDAAEALGRAAGSSNADVLTFSLRFAIERAGGSTAALEADVERILGAYDGYPAADGMRVVHLVLTDRDDEARRVLRRRMSVGIESIPRDSEWLETLWNLGEAAVALAEPDAVEAIHDALAPYAHRWVIDGVGAACYGIVSHQLGRLSAALDRPDEARQWLDAAGHAHQTIGATALTATTAALGRSLTPRVADRASDTETSINELSRDGPVWHLRWMGRATTVRHSKGIVDIALLLKRPETEILALDLVDPTGTAPLGDAGPMLDDQARRAYKRRLEELEADLDEASAMADQGWVARLEHERDLLVTEITRAYGPGGRARTVGDPAERARKAVGMRIATAIRAIADTAPDLARHLDRSILTGRYCSYRPETETSWTISTESNRTATEPPT